MDAKIFTTDGRDTEEKFAVLMLTCGAVNAMVHFVHEGSDGDEVLPEEVPLMYAASTDQLFIPMEVLAIPFLVNDPERGERLATRLSGLQNDGRFDAPPISMVQLADTDFLDSSVLLTMFEVWVAELDFAPACTLADMQGVVGEAMSAARAISVGRDPDSSISYH